MLPNGQVLQALDDLSAHSGGKTGVQSLAQVFLTRNEALQHAHAGNQIAQGFHLYAGGGVNCRAKIRSIGECSGLFRTILFDSSLYGIFCQTGSCICTAVNQIG